MSAPTFPPEHFGAWTLREIWSDQWWRLEGAGADIEARTESDVLDFAITHSESCEVFPPIAGIERLLELRREALGAPPPPSFCAWLDQEISERTESLEEIRARERAMDDVRDQLDAREPSTPTSIAEDLKAPEQGSFEGAEIVGLDIKDRVAEIACRAVREALAELRGELIPLAEDDGDTPWACGVGSSIAALDRLAERFK